MHINDLILKDEQPVTCQHVSGGHYMGYNQFAPVHRCNASATVKMPYGDHKKYCHHHAVEETEQNLIGARRRLQRWEESAKRPGGSWGKSIAIMNSAADVSTLRELRQLLEENNYRFK